MSRMLNLVLMAIFAFASATVHAEDSALRIHMISGSKEYKSEESLKRLKQHLEENYRVNITASWVKDGAKDLPGIEHVPEADLLIVFARRMKLPENQMAVIRKHWESGKPIVGIRTASHAFSREDNAVFDQQVMGGNYAGHFGGDPVRVTAASEKAAKHPVLGGVGPLTSKKLYKAGALADDAVLLQEGTIASKNETHPVTWLHEYNGGRTFYTSLGVPEDFQDENFLRMIENAIFWTTRQKCSNREKVFSQKSCGRLIPSSVPNRITNQRSLFLPRIALDAVS